MNLLCLTIIKYPYKVKINQQLGKGKFDAVLFGSKMCVTDLIMIWDADGTVPLNDTNKIIELALASGSPVIGDRLRGNIAKDAMKIANWFGNWIFAILWSPILNSKPTDMLCGTKIFPNSVFNNLPEFNDFQNYSGSKKKIVFATNEYFTSLGITPIPLSMPDDCYLSDPIESYRKYYLNYKTHFAKWTDRAIPYWFYYSDIRKYFK